MRKALGGWSTDFNGLNGFERIFYELGDGKRI